ARRLAGGAGSVGDVVSVAWEGQGRSRTGPAEALVAGRAAAQSVVVAVLAAAVGPGTPAQTLAAVVGRATPAQTLAAVVGRATPAQALAAAVGPATPAQVKTPPAPQLGRTVPAARGWICSMMVGSEITSCTYRLVMTELSDCLWCWTFMGSRPLQRSSWTAASGTTWRMRKRSSSSRQTASTEHGTPVAWEAPAL